MNAFGVTILAQPEEMGWRPETGTYRAQPWVGIESEVLALASDLRAARVPYRITRMSNGMLRIVAEYGSEETQPVDEPLGVVWSMPGTRENLSLWAAPKVAAEMVKISDLYRRSTLKAYIESFARGEYVINDGITAEFGITLEIIKAYAADNSSPAITSTFVERIITSMLKGAESIPTPHYVLRRVMTVAENTSITADYENVLKVYTSAALRTAEGVPDQFFGVMPGGYWLKEPPSIEQRGTGKTAIINEWTNAAEADALIYDAAT